MNDHYELVSSGMDIIDIVEQIKEAFTEAKQLNLIRDDNFVAVPAELIDATVTILDMLQMGMRTSMNSEEALDLGMKLAQDM